MVNLISPIQFLIKLNYVFAIDLLTSHVFCYRFRIDNTDHIIDVNKGNYPFEYDQVNIICPVYTPGTHEEDAEKYIIYNVSTSFTQYSILFITLIRQITV